MTNFSEKMIWLSICTSSRHTSVPCSLASTSVTPLRLLSSWLAHFKFSDILSGSHPDLFAALTMLAFFGQVHYPSLIRLSLTLLPLLSIKCWCFLAFHTSPSSQFQLSLVSLPSLDSLICLSFPESVFPAPNFSMELPAGTSSYLPDRFT